MAENESGTTAADDDHFHGNGDVITCVKIYIKEIAYEVLLLFC
jgi:hypothetical protein